MTELESFLITSSELNYSNIHGFEKLLEIYDQLFQKYCTKDVDGAVFDWCYNRETICLQIGLAYLYGPLNFNFTVIRGRPDLLKIEKFNEKMKNFEPEMEKIIQISDEILNFEIIKGKKKIDKESLPKHINKITDLYKIGNKVELANYKVHELFYDNSIQIFQSHINEFIRSKVKDFSSEDSSKNIFEVNATYDILSKFIKKNCSNQSTTNSPTVDIEDDFSKKDDIDIEDDMEKSAPKKTVFKTKTDRRKWTEDEEKALVLGVEQHGTNWAAILQNPEFSHRFVDRSNQNLKDKWRNLQTKK